MKIKNVISLNSHMNYRLRMNESVWIEWDPLERISVVEIAPLKVA